MFGLSIGKDAQERNCDWKEPKDWNKEIVETAGFVPLEVRFQKLQENGIRLQLRASEFDSVDMQKLYLDDQYRIEPDDELEDIEVKLAARQAYINELQKERSENTNGEVKSEVKNSKPEKTESEDDEVV